jgi:hypothetical protein
MLDPLVKVLTEIGVCLQCGFEPLS